ncbi:hypothetical protein ACAW74_04050 [Fibrella sp. WM1]|uniref:hypothetical protein n=1 Tax=Fibrella musci TaxID=3242485 RepID=UPI003522B1BB
MCVVYGFIPIVYHELNYLATAWFDKSSLLVGPLAKQTVPSAAITNRYWLDFSL